MFQAGFARLDVTPPLGSPLAGYYAERNAEGILDPLELNAIALKDDSNLAVYITADFLYVRLSAANDIRALVAEALEIPVENVFLQGLHQHTSLRIGGKKGQLSNMEDAAYLDVLYRKYCDVARLAVADLGQARVGVAEKETAEPISFIRRYRMKDGSTRTNPGYLNPDILEPIGRADNTVRLLRFFREGKKDIALVNFSTHPDVVGGKQISADWPGFVRRMTEKDLEDVHCILVNGAQGDTNHCDFSKPAITFKGDPQSTEKRYAFSRRMARIITDAVVSLWAGTVEKCAEPVTCHNRLEYIPTNTKYIDEIDRFKEMKRQKEAGEIKLALGPNAEMVRVLALYEESLFQKVPAAVLGFGDFAIAGFGGEPFTWYADKAREDAPDLYVIGACLVNGGEGYLPTEEAFDEGGYEAVSTRFTKPVAAMIPAAVKAMLDEHKKARG
ncbi:MAG: hypothetical protein IKC69_03280 [Clostridia bacterium]|nr:hypothetical protein [Clostridia bacterium]